MEIIYKDFETLPSTNSWVKEALPTLAPGTLLRVTAQQQTAGRGQYGREWLSPKQENIYASFGFLAEEDLDTLTLTYQLAQSTAKALQSFSLDCLLKWPNDVLVSGKKIAGILCETYAVDRFWGIVIGLGLNVNMEPAALESLGRPATSLYIETGKKYDSKQVLDAIQREFLQSPFTKWIKN